MPVLRRIVFYLLSVVYLVVCPYILLDALGYVVRSDAPQGVVKTGVISLETVPPGAAVFVEHRRYTERTPTLLRNFLPGEYQVRVSLKQHEPWVRRVAVEAEKATVFNRILLLPTRLVSTELLPEAFETLVPVPDTRFLLLGRGPLLGEVLVYDCRRGESRPLLPESSALQSSRVSWRAMVPGSPFLVLGVKGRGGERIVRVDLRAGEFPSAVMDVTKLFPRTPLSVEWDPRTPRQLFSVYRNEIDRVDVGSMAVYPKIAERVRGFGAAHQTAYVLTDDGRLRRLDAADPTRPSHEVWLEDLGLSAAPFTRGWFRIRPVSDELLLLWGARGELFLTRWPYEVADQGVRGVAFDPQQERLLVWEAGRIGVMDLSTDGERDPWPRWIVEDGRGISQAFWVYEGSHVLFRDRDAVWLVECAEGTAPRRIVEVRPDSSIAYVEDTGRLYYLTREGTFSSIELLANPLRSLGRASP